MPFTLNDNNHIYRYLHPSECITSTNLASVESNRALWLARLNCGPAGSNPTIAMNKVWTDKKENILVKLPRCIQFYASTVFLITCLFLNYNWRYHYQEERWGGLGVGILLISKPVQNLFWTFWHFTTICILSVHLNLIKLRNMPDRQASQMFAFLPRTNKFHIFV